MPRFDVEVWLADVYGFQVEAESEIEARQIVDQMDDMSLICKSTDDVETRVWPAAGEGYDGVVWGAVHDADGAVVGYDEVGDES